MAATDTDGTAGFSCRLLAATAARPGAIAILQLEGDVEPALRAITGIADWPRGRARLVRFADVDRGLAVRLTERVAQLMPHGGPRVVQRLCAWMDRLGIETASCDEVLPELAFPEASDRFEAMALAAVARAASPLAIDLLLDQPRRWRAVTAPDEEDLARSKRLDRLIEPAIVVVTGPVNVGKSTLGNALVGRSMSIATDLPGSTRDYTSGRVELAGIVVDWHDTPGRRETADAIEAAAAEIADRLVDRADLVIALTDHENTWAAMTRTPDLRVANKCDIAARHDADLAISATDGTGIPELVRAVRDLLVSPEDLRHPGVWLFDTRLL